MTWLDEIPLVSGTALSNVDHRLAGTELSFSKLLTLLGPGQFCLPVVRKTGSRGVITWPEQSLMAKDPSTLVSKPTSFHSLRAEACQAGTAIMIKTPFLTSLLPLVRLVSLSCYKKRGNWDTEQDDNLSKAAQGSHKKPCSVPGRILFWVPTRDMKKTRLWSAAGLRSSVRAHVFPEMVSRSKTGSHCLGGCFY